MKRIFAVCLFLLAGTVLFAQSVDVKAGGTYVMKSTDGGGKVPIYMATSDTPVAYVPDGTELTARGRVGSKNWFEVQYGNGGVYYADSANVVEETAESIATRAKIRKANNTTLIAGLTFWALIILVFILIRKKNKHTALKIYGEYYTQKRKEFPWLEKWIKENTDPVLARANSSASGTQWFIVFLFVVLVFGLGFILSLIVSANAGLAYYLTSAAVIALIFLICAKVGAWLIKKEDPATSSNQGHGLVLECPSCHCPHAWGMIFEQNFVGEVETTRTTTSTWDEDSSGRRVFGSTKTRTREDSVYSGKVVREFECENCGHTYHGEYGEAWGNPPITGPQNFDPPKYAWNALYETLLYGKMKEYNRLYEKNKSQQDMEYEKREAKLWRGWPKLKLLIGLIVGSGIGAGLLIYFFTIYGDASYIPYIAMGAALVLGIIFTFIFTFRKLWIPLLLLIALAAGGYYMTYLSVTNEEALTGYMERFIGKKSEAE